MFRPTVGELLGGISDSLRASVLPELPPGAAQRQLKAALHALGRLKSSCDRLPRYVEDDNDDILRSLRAVVDSFALAGETMPAHVAELAQHLDDPGDGIFEAIEIPGVSEPDLASAMTRNHWLQATLADLHAWLAEASGLEARLRAKQMESLYALYDRMNRRELKAWAVDAEIE